MSHQPGQVIVSTKSWHYDDWGTYRGSQHRRASVEMLEFSFFQCTAVRRVRQMHTQVTAFAVHRACPSGVIVIGWSQAGADKLFGVFQTKAVGVPAFAETPREVRDIVGDRAKAGRNELERLGYHKTGVTKTGGRAYLKFWNRSS